MMVLDPASNAVSSKGPSDMQDIIYAGIPIAFFALCVTYVRGLDRLVRSGEEAECATDLVDPPESREAVEARS
jgi:hypothetical protein